MKKVLMILLTLILSTSINAQTVLTPGDIALIAYQTDDPDRFAFVSLVDIAATTTITFTDNSWDGSALLTSEGNAEWTAPVGGLTKGTVIQIQGTSVTGGGSETGEATQDDFETGNLSAWSLESEPGNTIAIATDTVNNGTYSAKITYGGSNNIGKMSIPVSNLNSIYFRAYIWIPNNYNIGGVGFTTNDIVSFYDGIQKAVLCQVKSNADGTIGWWQATATAQDIGEDFDGVTGKLGRWTRLEFAWEKGSGSDGWCEVRVDGDSICGLGELATTGINIDSIKVGNFFSLDDPTGYIYFDDIVIDTTDWVGSRGGTVASNSMDLSAQGDQIFAYQGSSSNPSFIAGITSNTWITSTATENDSHLPSSLTNGTTARDFATEIDNGYFNIATNLDLKEDLLASIYNVSNWTRDDAIQTWPSWSFTVDDPVPVELSSFTAKVLRNGGIQLNWITETEVDNYGFEIDRLQDYPASGKKLQEWEKVGFVEGHGNSNSPKVYTFLDDYARYGKYAYRLKQIDTDGDFEYSDVIEVNSGNIPDGFVLEQNYPNPFNPTTSIKFALAKTEQAELKIFDVLGNEVVTLFNGIADGGKVYEVEFSAKDGSASGVYFYRLETENRIVNKKMVLLK